MASPIQLVEQALVDRLRDAVRAYKGLVVESYGAQLDDETFGWVRTLPATWVTFDKLSDMRRVGRTAVRCSADFEVLVAQRALRENDRRLGAPGVAEGVGIYQLLEDNKLLLANRKLGLAIQPLTPGAVRSVMKGMAGRDAVAVYAQTFSTGWVETLPDPDMTDEDLLTIGLDYLLKPGDDTADSGDVVTLRTP